MTAASAPPVEGSLLVGTEAVLHRVTATEVVVISRRNHPGIGKTLDLETLGQSSDAERDWVFLGRDGNVLVANAFGMSYPGAGATIAQGLVFGYVAAMDAATR